MSHEVETMAYAGSLPWHGLGVPVSNDLTPVQMMEKAGLNWTVSKRALQSIGSVAHGIERIDVPGWKALVRDTDHAVLDVVSDRWQPFQNLEAFEFFNDFVAAGDMEMHTAGSLKGGRRVWALAKVKDSFTILGGKDRTDAYLLFSNPHKAGHAIEVRFTPIRVVCNNTITLALGEHSHNFVRFTHVDKFDAEKAKLMLGITQRALVDYEEKAKFLSAKRASTENVVEFFKRVYDLKETQDPDVKERNQAVIDRLKGSLVTQPGADLGAGTWWSALHAVTYTVDHVSGRGDRDSRLDSAWYGVGQTRKSRALGIALEMASA